MRKSKIWTIYRGLKPAAPWVVFVALLVILNVGFVVVYRPRVGALGYVFAVLWSFVTAVIVWLVHVMLGIAREVYEGIEPTEPPALFRRNHVADSTKEASGPTEDSNGRNKTTINTNASQEP